MTGLYHEKTVHSANLNNLNKKSQLWGSITEETSEIEETQDRESEKGKGLESQHQVSLGYVQ